MKWLGDGIKQLVNLKGLVLNLNGNNLGESECSMKYLTEGIKQLVNLKKLELYLQSNYLGVDND